MPKSKPGYTLKELRAALENACAAHQMCAPSLISLKNWSAQGTYKRAATIHEAISISIERMRRNRGAYAIAPATTRDALQQAANQAWLRAELEKRAPQTSKDRTPEDEADLLDALDPLQRVIPRALSTTAADDDDDVDEGARQAHSSLQPLSQEESQYRASVNSKLNGLDEQMRLLRHEIRTALQQVTHYASSASGQSSVHPDISQAITQLDSVRKHLMSRMDAEIQAMRAASQQTSAAAMPATLARPAKDDLNAEMRIFTQQVLTRLARIEGSLAN